MGSKFLRKSISIITEFLSSEKGEGQAKRPGQNPSSCLSGPQLTMAEARRNAGEKALFTPGPLNCTRSVKEAMLRDLGSRDAEFVGAVREIRSAILKVAGVQRDEFSTILLQGSGTYCVEAVLQNVVPKKGGRVLLLVNGAYGRRMETICGFLEGAVVEVLEHPEDEAVSPKRLELHLQKEQESYSAVCVVHCETSSGLLNPVAAVAELVRRLQPGAAVVVDAMSSFGAVPLPLDQVDFVVSSANKCLQGVPGFGFIIARTQKLIQCQGNARCLSFDLVAQHKGLEGDGQFRFTPPTHALLAFRQALIEFEEEGGLTARAARYKKNCQIIQVGMRALGFETLLDPKAPGADGYIISSFRFPEHPNFDFESFYKRLSASGLVIYPGKVTRAPCFRIGHIGDLNAQDMQNLISRIKVALGEMQVVM